MAAISRCQTPICRARQLQRPETAHSGENFCIMKLTPLLSPQPVRLTGVATVAADTSLTLHAASDGFAAFFGPTSSGSPKSLALCSSAFIGGR